MKRRQLLQCIGLLPILTLFKSLPQEKNAPFIAIAKDAATKPLSPEEKPPTFKICGPSPELTFNNFLVHRENEVAHAMAYKICSLQNYNLINPFIITGECGNGTTHLAHAIANELLLHNPKQRIHIVSAEKFLNQCIQSIRKREMQHFRKFYRENINVLIVDGFQYLQRGQAVQEEMLHTLKELHESKCLVILTTDLDVNDLVYLHKDMADLLRGGVTTQIYSPKLNSRKSLIRYFSVRYDAPLSNNQINKLAKQNISVRALQGQVKKIQLMKELGV